MYGWKGENIYRQRCFAKCRRRYYCTIWGNYIGICCRNIRDRCLCTASAYKIRRMWIFHWNAWQPQKRPWQTCGGIRQGGRGTEPYSNCCRSWRKYQPWKAERRIGSYRRLRRGRTCNKRDIGYGGFWCCRFKAENAVRNGKSIQCALHRNRKRLWQGCAFISCTKRKGEMETGGG